MNNLDFPVYQDFVSPRLCKWLNEAGLTSNTAFHYMMTGEIAQLNSYCFDFDDYYENGDKLVDLTKQGMHIIPAYQTKDVEKILPGNFLLQRNEKGYELMMENFYGLESVVEFRLPDAFAKMALQAMQKRVIKVKVANMQILQTT